MKKIKYTFYSFFNRRAKESLQRRTNNTKYMSKTYPANKRKKIIRRSLKKRRNNMNKNEQ